MMFYNLRHIFHEYVDIYTFKWKDFLIFCLQSLTNRTPLKVFSTMYIVEYGNFKPRIWLFETIFSMICISGNNWQKSELGIYVTYTTIAKQIQDQIQCMNRLLMFYPVTVSEYCYYNECPHMTMQSHSHHLPKQCHVKSCKDSVIMHV